MWFLLISIAALAAGPLVLMWSRRHGLTSALDGFVLVTISGLVLVHLIPHALEVSGPWVIALALLGFLGPSLVEKYLIHAAQQAHRATVVFAISGMAIHAVGDGLALALSSGHEHGSLLGLAVLLHRLPVSLTVWWILAPTRGRIFATLTLATIAVATVIGFASEGMLASTLDSDGFAPFPSVGGWLSAARGLSPAGSSPERRPQRSNSGSLGGRGHSGPGACALAFRRAPNEHRCGVDQFHQQLHDPAASDGSCSSTGVRARWSCACCLAQRVTALAPNGQSHQRKYTRRHLRAAAADLLLWRGTALRCTDPTWCAGHRGDGVSRCDA